MRWSVSRIRATWMMSIRSSVVPAGTDPGGRPGDSSCIVGPGSLLDRDGLRQVAGLVDVGPAGDGHVVREELQRNDREDPAQQLVGIGHPADVVRDTLTLGVAFGRDGHDLRVTGPT